MRRIFLFAVPFLLAFPLQAQKMTGKRCPEGTRASFTGHPFRPLECLTLPVQNTADSPAPAAPAFAKEIKLNDLAGRWEGYFTFGIERFEALLSLEKEGFFGGNFIARLEAREYRILLLHVLEARLKAEAPGRYAVDVGLEGSPYPRLNGHARLGRSSDPDFDYEILLAYADGQTHRLRLKRQKDALLYFYEDLSRPGAPSSRGTLAATKRQAL